MPTINLDLFWCVFLVLWCGVQPAKTTALLIRRVVSTMSLAKRKTSVVQAVAPSCQHVLASPVLPFVAVFATNLQSAQMNAVSDVPGCVDASTTIRVSDRVMDAGLCGSVLFWLPSYLFRGL